MTTGQSPKTPSELEQLDQELEIEVRNWQAAGLHPDMITYDLFGMSAKIDYLMKNLKDAMSEEQQNEFEIGYRKLKLERLRELRVIGEKQKREAILSRARIVGPNGQPLL